MYGTPATFMLMSGRVNLYKASTYDRRGKFSSGRDEVFYTMELDGWANESSGDVEAPTHAFAKLSNSPAEMLEVIEAFAEIINEAMIHHGESLETMVGHFLLQHDSQGGFHVTEFMRASDLATAYGALERQYASWDDEGDDTFDMQYPGMRDDTPSIDLPSYGE